MSTKRDISTIEAALYAAGRSLSLRELCGLLGTPSETYVRRLLEALKGEYRRKGGPFVLQEVSKDSFSLRLAGEYISKLGNIVPKVKPTRGALKTLALLAYLQAGGVVLQSKLAAMRGGRVYDHVKQLAALGFIESRPLGRTRVLRTTKRFADYFGVEDDPDKIRERLEESR